MKVLLVIDVQVMFLNERTQPAADFIQDLLEREDFDLVIQSCWKNDSESRYVTELGYLYGMEPEETIPFLNCPGAAVLVRSTYSAANEELLRLISTEDELYLVGLETDACVLATLFALWDKGFHFHVYEKGVETSEERLSEPVLELIRRQFGQGTVLS